MQTDHSLHTTSKILSKSDEIDSIVTALAKAKHNQDLRDRDVDALRDALDFLGEVQEGYNWMERPTPSVSRRSKLYAQSLHAAVESWMPDQNENQFLDNIDQMKERLEYLLQDDEEESDLDKIIDFFNTLLNTHLDEVDKMRSKSIINKGSDKWVYRTS